MDIKARVIIGGRVWAKATELTKMAGILSSKKIDRDIHFKFIGSFFDISQSNVSNYQYHMNIKRTQI